MGYFRHNAIVIIASDHRAPKIHEALNNIRLAECPAMPEPTISRIGINGYRTITVAADGSKEDWPDSDFGDVAREQMRKWLGRNSYEKWVEIVMDEDCVRAVIASDNDNKYGK